MGVVLFSMKRVKKLKQLLSPMVYLKDITKIDELNILLFLL